MISMTKIRLGALRCPVDGTAGTGAKAVFGGGTGVSWTQRHVDQPVFSAVDLIPPYAVDNSISLSAPPERSP